MKNLVKFSVDKAITVFMAVIIVIVFGVVSYTNLTTDLLPSMNIPFSVVVTVYPGASPTEIEEVVTEPIEEALATTTNIKEVTSMSQENVSVVILEFNSDTNMDSAVIEMRETLDMVTSNFDDMVGSPMIIKLNPDLMPIMQLSVSKEGLSPQELTIYVEEEVLPQIERVAGVASVDVSGAYESEVQVILDQVALDALNDQLTAIYTGIGMDEEDMLLIDKQLISDILAAQNFEFPVGYIDVENIDYLVRVGDEFESVEEVAALTIFSIPANPLLGLTEDITVTIDDIADVNFVNANDKEYSKVNGNNAISITVQKSSEFATTDVTNAINEILMEISDEEGGADFTVLLDQGEYIEQATGNVVNNLLYGAILAIIVLIIFLRSARATFIVAVSIPISLMFAIVLIYFTGITLNIVSLGGLALGIGMLVDNSIVVMENIFRLKKLGKSNREAAIEGTRQVAGAIFASTITTISVFIPVLFIEGFIKEIFLQMALTIAYSLTASLVIALTLVPAISSKVLKEDSKAKDGEEKTTNKVKDIYEKVFEGAFKFKYFILAFVVALFAGSIFIALTNGFEYFPASDEGQLTIEINNPVDNPISDDEFITLLDELTVDILEIDDVDVVGISLGSMQGSFLGFSSADSASANVVLKDGRELTTLEVQDLIETLMGEDYTQIEFSISGSQQQTDMLAGSGYQLQLKGYDLDVLKAEAIEIAGIIGAVEGVEEVDNGIGRPAEEIKITVDKNLAVQKNVVTAQVLGAVAEYIAPEDKITEITVDGDIYEVYV
jgi:HAE1 family hydrophobic/amphiphilic exporter-1